MVRTGRSCGLGPGDWRMLTAQSACPAELAELEMDTCPLRIEPLTALRPRVPPVRLALVQGAGGKLVKVTGRLGGAGMGGREAFPKLCWSQGPVPGDDGISCLVRKMTGVRLAFSVQGLPPCALHPRHMLSTHRGPGHPHQPQHPFSCLKRGTQPLVTLFSSLYQGGTVYIKRTHGK